MFSNFESILVVGGGIAGIQACLDLADSGYFVYLIEKLAFIGGKTAQLDKIFPINDCPFCIRYNEHMECASHTNIEILTLSEVKDIKGASGNFKATIIQHPRHNENAIYFDKNKKAITLNVGSVILATGFDSVVPSYCEYIKFPNVITGMEFERIMSLNGSSGGHLIRPSDRKKPKNIAWLQCIGSRDIQHNYCSSVCCMYAVKQASAAACAVSLNMAVSRAALYEPIKGTGQKPVPAGLIVGGGVTGMVSCLCLADQGYKAYLIEKTDKLGGHALKLRKTFKGEDVTSYVKELVDKVENHPLIDVYLNSVVRDTDGYAGNFSTRIAISSLTETKNIKHSVTIISTGADFLRTSEYLYKKNSNVLSWFQLDKMLSEEPNTIKKANVWVFILCVGSRESERPYCSKICCSSALRNALELKKLNPAMEIYVLYRDMRTYGLIEDLYTDARDKGIVFIRYKLDGKPEVEEDQDGRLKVRILDNLLGEHIIIQPDFITLQTAIVPENNEKLAKLFKLPVNQDGFFMEAHKKFKPVEFSAKGIYLAGLVHYPKPIDETISQAQAAAAKAVTVLSKEYITTSNEVASINLKSCAACLTCVRICPSGAVSINAVGEPYVVPVKCRGCGICVIECPTKAIILVHFKNDPILTECEAFLEPFTEYVQ